VFSIISMDHKFFWIYKTNWTWIIWSKQNR